MTYLYVALGGALGTVLRFSIGKIKYDGLFPLHTLIINIIGCFVIGIVSGLMLKNNQNSQFLNLFLKVGFCGGFTTFSSFSLECVSLIQKGAYFQAGIYIILSLCISFIVLYGAMEWISTL